MNPAMTSSTISNFLPSFLVSMADFKWDPVGSPRPGIWIRRRHDVSCLKVFCHDEGLVGRGEIRLCMWLIYIEVVACHSGYPGLWIYYILPTCPRCPRKLGCLLSLVHLSDRAS